MKIVDKRPNKLIKDFCALKAGDVFSYRDEFFIKLNERVHRDNTYCLSNNRMYLFSNETLCYPLPNVELVIEGH